MRVARCDHVGVALVVGTKSMSDSEQHDCTQRPRKANIRLHDGTRSIVASWT
jgi:hypothetical protein